MTIVVPSMVPSRAHKAIGDWRAMMEKPAEHQYLVVDNSETNRGVLASMQEGYEKAGQEIIALLHDDVDINEENWDTRVEAEFNDPSVGVVGFGGGLGAWSPRYLQGALFPPTVGKVVLCQQHG